MIQCEVCHRDFKGKRGLKLHQKQYLENKSSNEEQSSLPSADVNQKTNPKDSRSNPEKITFNLQVVHREENASPDVSSEVNKAYEEIVQ